jgi:hypothetical protein
MFRKALDYLGYRDARVVAVFGNQNGSQAVPGEWRQHLDCVEIHWVDSDGGYAAQGMARYRHISPAADVAFLCDADTLVVGPLDDLIETVVNRRLLAGVPCLSPPPHPVKWPMPDPFYVNHGFVAGTPAILARLYKASLTVSLEYQDPFWVPQISIPFAVHAAGIPAITLPLRYNFPNDGGADKRYPDELRQAKVIHYMNCGEYDRGRIFREPEAFYDFMGRRFLGSSRVFQTRVRQITDGIYPFPYFG